MKFVTMNSLLDHQVKGLSIEPPSALPVFKIRYNMEYSC